MATASPRLRAALLIVSDTAFKDPSTDKCAPVLQDVFKTTNVEWDIAATEIVPDLIDGIQKFVKRWSDENDWVNCIITSGGTGFAVKDVTPEVDSRSKFTSAFPDIYRLFLF
jgi:gephyrin